MLPARLPAPHDAHHGASPRPDSRGRDTPSVTNRDEGDSDGDFLSVLVPLVPPSGFSVGAQPECRGRF